MGQSMVAITEADCTGCDLCIPFCPFEALLPLFENPREQGKRPVVVVEHNCVGCLSCIGSCPTSALHEVEIPFDSDTSPLLLAEPRRDVVSVKRFTRDGLMWPMP